jgi:hypothetical protein
MVGHGSSIVGVIGVFLPDDTVAVSPADRTWEVPGQHPVLRCRRTATVSAAGSGSGRGVRARQRAGRRASIGQARSLAISERITVAAEPFVLIRA